MLEKEQNPCKFGLCEMTSVKVYPALGQALGQGSTQTLVISPSPLCQVLFLKHNDLID